MTLREEILKQVGLLTEMPMKHTEYYDDYIRTNVGMFRLENKNEFEVDNAKFNDILEYIKEGSVKRWLVSSEVSPEHYFVTIGSDGNGEPAFEFDEFGDNKAKYIISILIKKLDTNAYNTGMKDLIRILNNEDSLKKRKKLKELINFIKSCRN